ENELAYHRPFCCTKRRAVWRAGLSLPVWGVMKRNCLKKASANFLLPDCDAACPAPASDRKRFGTTRSELSNSRRASAGLFAARSSSPRSSRIGESRLSIDMFFSERSSHYPAFLIPPHTLPHT